jgi:flagellum-specific ATP synthase
MTRFAAQIESVESAMPFGVAGEVHAISGLTIEATELNLPIGSLCEIKSLGDRTSMAEVIGFAGDRTLLMPLTSVAGVTRGDKIANLSAAPRIWCSHQLLGRVLNGFGDPMDGKGPLLPTESRRIDGRGVAPMSRENIRKPIATGVRAIDALHTCGLGQRMGIFSGPGVGKSTLLSSISRHTSADVSVIALIGERGREVQEFLTTSLGEKGLARCVVIVSTSDDPPLLRVRAAKVASTICEYLRDQGLNVLLLLDSLTRLCQAQRQIGLAAKEPPATKGYPPSVFALIPEILERAGNSANGSITGFYTVLVEGDDFNEPIPDAVKGVSDGHLWLTRTLANRGHFPAIDILQSISRVRGDVADKEQTTAARRILSLWAVYQDIEDLVNIGAYVPGSSLEYDLAIQSRPRIAQFLQQDPTSATTLEQAKKQVLELAAMIDQHEKILKTQAAKKQPARANG